MESRSRCNPAQDATIVRPRLHLAPLEEQHDTRGGRIWSQETDFRCSTCGRKRDRRLSPRNTAVPPSSDRHSVPWRYCRRVSCVHIVPSAHAATSAMYHGNSAHPFQCSGVQRETKRHYMPASMMGVAKMKINLKTFENDGCLDASIRK